MPAVPPVPPVPAAAPAPATAPVPALAPIPVVPATPPVPAVPLVPALASDPPARSAPPASPVVTVPESPPSNLRFAQDTQERAVSSASARVVIIVRVAYARVRRRVSSSVTSLSGTSQREGQNIALPLEAARRIARDGATRIPMHRADALRAEACGCSAYVEAAADPSLRKCHLPGRLALNGPLSLVTLAFAAPGSLMVAVPWAGTAFGKLWGLRQVQAAVRCDSSICTRTSNPCVDSSTLSLGGAGSLRCHGSVIWRVVSGRRHSVAAFSGRCRQDPCGPGRKFVTVPAAFLARVGGSFAPALFETGCTLSGVQADRHRRPREARSMGRRAAARRAKAARRRQPAASS